MRRIWAHIMRWLIQSSASGLATGYGPPPGITFDRFVRACVLVRTVTEAFQRSEPFFHMICLLMISSAMIPIVMVGYNLITNSSWRWVISNVATTFLLIFVIDRSCWMLPEQSVSLYQHLKIVLFDYASPNQGPSCIRSLITFHCSDHLIQQVLSLLNRFWSAWDWFVITLHLYVHSIHEKKMLH